MTDFFLSDARLNAVALGIFLMGIAPDNTEVALYTVAMAFIVAKELDNLVQWYLDSHDPLFVRFGIGTPTE